MGNQNEQLGSQRSTVAHVNVPVGRREFLGAVAAPLALSALSDLGTLARSSPSRIRAVAFDGFAVFDAMAIVDVAEAIVPGRGRELVMMWRARHFEYQWLRTLGGRYADFRRTAADALNYTCEALRLVIGVQERQHLVEAQLALLPWPDAASALQLLRGAGLRLALLSNMTASMLEEGAQRAGFRQAFEHVLSTDRVQVAKPHARAYAMAIDAFGLEREEIAFVAFAGWDVVGASWFGYPTIWMNRLSAPPEQLDAEPRAVVRNLGDVVSWAVRG